MLLGLDVRDLLVIGHLRIKQTVALYVFLFAKLLGVLELCNRSLMLLVQLCDLGVVFLLGFCLLLGAACDDLAVIILLVVLVEVIFRFLDEGIDLSLVLFLDLNGLVTFSSLLSEASRLIFSICPSKTAS